ncbi:tungsten ABC transporter substrate-binding protein [Methanoculleus taiwanensis]|uniref:Tungsten ABC transporter substrate-binding protein n=1 Tax=Methanoculleus taiwanensis TaxID=1550565 RepID=A0A498H3G0_9EURY|nr:substrate-binding domain-containing protein [Methanoculleus taiwanensis]RXE57333.1 tungsten ABC transporter substrate-binding protein [Methanoculleus taiwanensis]
MTPKSWMPRVGIVALLVLICCTAWACAQPVGTEQTSEPANPDVLRIATTTSLYDTGLLDELEAMYENMSGVDVQITSTGTGQALELGERCDVDVVLVHAPSLEQQFIDEGYGVNQRCFAYNNFIIVGPPDDPAGIMNMTPTEAFQAIYQAGTGGTEGVQFVSRGDESGTNTREIQIWEAAGYNYTDDIRDSGNWYLESGSGMGETLTLTNERGAYTLSDIGTFLSFQQDLDLEQLVTEGDDLLNRYSVMQVNPDTCPSVNYPEAVNFTNWLISNDTKQFIGEYGMEEFGQPLFTPLYPPECTEPPFNCTCAENVTV